MGMDSVLTSFQSLRDDPIAWALVGLVAAKALFSLACFTRCPVRRQSRLVDARAAREATNARFVHAPRFLSLMLVGIVLSVGGLYTLSDPELGGLALAAMVLGVFLMLTEPSQLTIEDATLRVVAARAEGGEAVRFALERLRSAHLGRLGLEFAFAAALALLVAAY